MSKEITISAHKLTISLLLVALGLTAAHIIVMFIWYLDLLPINDWTYLAFFDLDEEESIGTWFSALILFTAAQLSLLNAYYAHGNPEARCLGWLFLAIGFTLLSLDEIAGFHEFVNTVVEDTHWTTFGLIIVVITGLVYLPFLWSLPIHIRCLLIVSGIIYIGGAVGVERATIWYEDNDQLDTLAYNLWNALEELMEMSGVILYIYTLLNYVAENVATQRQPIRYNT